MVNEESYYAEERPEKVEIRYKRAKFHRRVFANLIDLLLLALLGLCIFLGVRAIVQGTTDYQARVNAMDEVKNASHLYQKETDGTYTNLVTYLNNDDTLSTRQKKNAAKAAIDEFIVYIGEAAGEDSRITVQANYDEYRLSDTMVYNGKPYFIEEAGSIIENPDCGAYDSQYYENCYGPYIDGSANGFMIQLVPGYYANLKYTGYVILFVEIPISYALSAILVYCIPPFIFRRGHKTIGKLLYNIGLVDSRNCLNVKTGRMVARTAIVYFGEVILSIFTLAIPFFVSFSMMAFSKKRQSFPDYMLGLEEIDTSDNKIFYSLEEAMLEQESGAKKPVDFTPISRL